MFKKRVIIFGAGKAGRDAFKILETQFSIIAFADNSPELWDQKINGVVVIPPDSIAKTRFSFIVIASTYWREIEDDLVSRHQIRKNRIEVYPIELLNQGRELNISPLNYLNLRGLLVALALFSLIFLGIFKAFELFISAL